MNEIKTFDERKKTLIKIGKEKGYITFEELADNLKGLEMDSDSLDELYNLFHDMGIEVVSDDVDDTSDESGSGVGLDDLSIPKTISINDPVRMYLKEIGKISLLSLDEELELSKRVAEGDVEAKNKLLKVPFEVVEDKGVVSSEVARLMVIGLHELTKAEVCVSVTGFAGRDTEERTENDGLCYFGIKIKDEIYVSSYTAKGNRNESRVLQSGYILKMVLEKLKTFC